MAKRLKWGTIEYLNTLIDEYFDTEPTPSIAGLRVHLGISDNCWRYYVNDVWRIHRKSPEEIEEIKDKQAETDGNEAFEDLLEISAKSRINDGDNIEDDHIKEQVSLALKKAKDRIEVFISKQVLTARNPAGSIFYAKAALGYRETTPEVAENINKIPTTINILVMPPPDKPKQLEDIIATTYSVLPDNSSK
jgi:hypothetical protein